MAKPRIKSGEHADQSIRSCKIFTVIDAYAGGLSPAVTPLANLKSDTIPYCQATK
jgi:hypothetical protein